LITRVSLNSNQIAARQESGQVGESPIDQSRAVYVQQPAARARGAGTCAISPGGSA